MKNTFRVLFIALALSLVIVSCQKESATIEPQPEQTTHELGALLLPVQEYKLLPVAEIPKVDLRLRAAVVLTTPPVGNQGYEGSCTAFGTTYAARSINWEQSHGGTYSFTSNIFSPEYVYNQVKASGSCSSGAYVTKALDLLKKQGVCRWSVMPYVDGACNVKPTTAQKADASNYRISGYQTSPITTTAIKSFLASGKPVIVAGPVNQVFEYPIQGTVFTDFVGSILGEHCYCVVGFDDTKNAFKIQNSWGTSWLDGGFGWIDYDHISQWWKEAYVIN